MQAGPSSAPNLPAAHVKKRRIPQAGVAIMEEWLTQHGANPTKGERSDMLYRIRLIPGGETYDDKGVAEWFKRRRRATNPNPGSPYPTLSTKAIKYLTTLSLSNPFPPPYLIGTWAELLRASTDDVTKWLAEHRSPVQNLPTPVSTSPEPSSEYQWALKTDPINSPVIPSRNMPNFCSTHVPQSHTLSNQQLIDAISEASQLKIAVTPIPKTLEEFESMFEPYCSQMQNIIRQNEAYLQP